jgi:hypothetical protein
MKNKKDYIKEQKKMIIILSRKSKGVNNMNKYKIEEILSNIQFQVYSDMNFIEPLELDKETWKELLEYINKQKEVLDKIKEKTNKIIESNNSALSNPEYTIVSKHQLLKLSNEELKDILELLEEIE